MSGPQVKVLGRRDLVLFTVSAVVLLDTLAASASIGVSSLFWWPFLGVVFLLPMGLITAELATMTPSEGGVYAWVRQAFGQRWAARVAWAYWVNVAIWLPAIFVLAAGILAQVVGVDIPLSGQILFCVVCGWLVVGLEFIGLSLSKWVPNLGAILKFSVFGALIVMGLRYGFSYGWANEIDVQSIAPTWQNGIKYLPVVIFGMLGLELVCGAADEMRHPKRDISVSIFLSGFITIVLYVSATVGILAAIPVDEIDMVEGLLDTLRRLFADVPAGSVIVVGLGTAALVTLFANAVAWAIGANRMAAEAAIEGQLPGLFSLKHSHHGGPIGAALMLGTVCTIVLLVYGRLATSNGDLFWTLLSFSGVIFMMPYVAMVFAFLKLRTVEPDTVRPFRVAGGSFAAYAIAAVCVIVLLLTIFLFLFVPGDGVQWSTLSGVILVLLIGEGLIQRSMSRRRLGHAGPTS